MNTKKWAALWGVLSVLGLFSTSTFAASIDPATFEATIGVGETVMVDKVITTDPGGASIVDVYFLADNTSSMSGIIDEARDGASAILAGLAAASPGSDFQFGVGSYVGDPSEGGVSGATAYDVDQVITANAVAVQAAIDTWAAIGGADFQEANLYALQQAATNGANSASGVGSGEPVGWRAGAQRIVALFGDAPGHDDTVDLDEAIDALVDNGVTVVAFNTVNAGGGIDSFDGDGASADTRNQASEYTGATGGSLTNNFGALTGDAFVAAVVDAIGTATTTIDLLFETSGDTSGLNIEFMCTDAAGCDDVPGGESRDFKMTVTGASPGIFEFEVFARGVAATESDRIEVTGAGGAVPEPSTVALLGLGLLGLGFRRMRRQA